MCHLAHVASHETQSRGAATHETPAAKHGVDALLVGHGVRGAFQFDDRLAGAAPETKGTRTRNRLARPYNVRTQCDVKIIKFNPPLTESDRGGFLVDGNLA